MTWYNEKATPSKLSLFDKFGKSGKRSNYNWLNDSPSKWGEENKTTWPKKAIVGGLGMAAISTAAMALINSPTNPGNLLADKCQQEARTVVSAYTDHTNSMDGFQKTKVKNILERVIPQDFTSGVRVEVSALKADYQSPYRPVFQGCSPRNADETNPLFQTRKDVAATWEEDFGIHYRKSLPLTADKADLAFTPLFEGVAAKSIDLQSRYPNAKSYKQHILTDGLHNTPRFSVYAENDRYLLTDKNKHILLEEAALHKQAGTYKNMDIQFHIIVRHDHKNRSGRQMAGRQIEMQEFLKSYFEMAGAKSVSIKPL